MAFYNNVFMDFVGSTEHPKNQPSPSTSNWPLMNECQSGSHGSILRINQSYHLFCFVYLFVALCFNFMMIFFFVRNMIMCFVIKYRLVLSMRG